METSQDLKRKIIRASVLMTAHSFPQIPLNKSCLYMTAVLSYLAHIEIPEREFTFKAGSAWWHHKGQAFGYEWKPIHHQTIECVVNGVLPELHCWVEMGDGTIIDPIVGLLKPIVKEQYKDAVIWNDWNPPDYLWGKPETFMSVATYKPCDLATSVAVNLLVDILNAQNMRS